MIIRDFTDNDLYKFTTMNAVQKKFPYAKVKYKFIDRGSTKFPIGFAKALRREIDAMSDLYLSEEAEKYIRERCYYFDPVFIDLLKGYSYNPDEVKISQDGGKLNVEIEGYWFRAVLWEVPVMAIISELYFLMTGQKADNYEDRAVEKAKAFNGLDALVSEFGTRRRYSFDVQERIVELLKDNMGNNLNGTSNLYLAAKYRLTPIGTHPHEWFMYHGAHFGYRMANAIALENWAEVYQGSLGIALSDTYTTDNFLRNFNVKLSKLFDGVRWDSGDPVEFTEKVINHYKDKRINPMSKSIVYSDALDLDKVRQIKNYVDGRIRDSYGIGTYLTNDVGVKPLNMVIKLTEVKPAGFNAYLPVIKLSDIKGKHTGEKDEIERCLNTISYY